MNKSCLTISRIVIIKFVINISSLTEHYKVDKMTNR